MGTTDAEGNTSEASLALGGSLDSLRVMGYVLGITWFCFALSIVTSAARWLTLLTLFRSFSDISVVPLPFRIVPVFPSQLPLSLTSLTRFPSLTFC